MQFRRGATHYHGRGGGAAGAKDSLLRSRSGPGQPSGQLRSGPRRSPGPCPRLRIGSPRAADGEEWPLRSINSPVLAPVATAMVSEKCRRSWKCTRDSPRAVRAFPNAGASALGRGGTPSRPVHGRASGMDRSTRSGSRLAGGSEVLLGYGRREPTSEAVSSRGCPPHPRRPVVVAPRSRDPQGRHRRACLPSPGISPTP